MAKPAAGTYRIVSAQGSATSPLSLDVSKSSMANGANVALWTPTWGANQLFDLSYRSDGSAQLLSRWSGKSLDVAGDSLVPGTNVLQWTDTDQRNQRWAIDTDGLSATHDGQTWPTYTIRLSAAPTLALDAASGSQGANVCVSTAGGSTLQRWLLVPPPAVVSGGTYELRSMLKTSMAVDVMGASRVRGGNVGIYSASGGNNQKFVLTEESSGKWSLRNVNSGMYVDVSNGATAPGTNVLQWTDTDQRNQRWRLTQYGTTMVDGIECAVATLGSYVDGTGTTRHMDVHKALTTDRANVELDVASGDLSQRFALYPTSPRGEELPVPARLGWSAAVGDVSWEPTRPEADRLYPTWLATGTWASDSFNHYEIRTRSSAMRSSDSQWWAWSAWSGWRVAAVTVSGQRVWLTEGLTAAVPEGAKAMRHDVQVRAAGVGAGDAVTHGHVASATLVSMRMPTVTLSDPGFGPEGLRLSYSAAGYAGGTTSIEIRSVRVGSPATSVLPSRLLLRDLDPSGSVLVPVDRLSRWVEDGETVRIGFGVGTDQMPLMAETVQTGAMTVSYDTGSGLSAVPQLSAGPGRSVELRLASASVSGAWMRTGGRLVPMEVTGGVASVLPPLGDAASQGGFEVFAAARSADGDQWGVAHLSASEVLAAAGSLRPCHAWNWAGGHLLLELREDRPLETSYDVDTDVRSYRLDSRAWESHTVGPTKAAKLMAAGCFGAGLDAEATREAVEALLDARHATYRSPHGLVCDVALRGARLTCSRGIWSCEVEMSREAT